MASTVLLLSSGCALARTAGGDFASGAIATLQSSDSAVVDLQRRLADTAFVFIEAEFADAVLEPARSTWAKMRRGVRDEGDSLAIRLDHALERALGETIPQHMAASGAELQRQLDLVARSFAVELTRAFAEGVSSSVQPAVDSLVASAVRSSVATLETDLRPSVHALMLDLRDSLQLRIGDVDRAVSGSQTVSGLRYALFGGGGFLLLTALVTVAGRSKRRGRALDALIDAIESGGDERTKRAVHHCAADAGVGGWLRRRVRQRTGGSAGSEPTSGGEAT